MVFSAVHFQLRVSKSYRDSLDLDLRSDRGFEEVHPDTSNDDIQRFGQAALNLAQVPSAESQQAAELPALLHDRRRPYCAVCSTCRQGGEEVQRTKMSTNVSSGLKIRGQKI